MNLKKNCSKKWILTSNCTKYAFGLTNYQACSFPYILALMTFILFAHLNLKRFKTTFNMRIHSITTSNTICNYRTDGE